MNMQPHLIWTERKKIAVSRIQMKKLKIKQVFDSNTLALYPANKIVSYFNFFFIFKKWN